MRWLIITLAAGAAYLVGYAVGAHPQVCEFVLRAGG